MSSSSACRAAGVILEVEVRKFGVYQAVERAGVVGIAWDGRNAAGRPLRFSQKRALLEVAGLYDDECCFGWLLASTCRPSTRYFSSAPADPDQLLAAKEPDRACFVEQSSPVFLQADIKLDEGKRIRQINAGSGGDQAGARSDTSPRSGP